MAKDKPTYEDLQTQLASANAQLAAAAEQKLQADADEKLIAAKMEKGLTRAQAAAVVRRQREYDASPLAEQQRKRIKN